METKTLIKELIESGLTQVEIAQKLDCSQSYVSDLYNGKKGTRLSFAFGTKLAFLHKRLVLRKRKDAPKEAAHG